MLGYRILVTAQVAKYSMTTTAISRLYYDPARTSAFSILLKIRTAAKNKVAPTPKKTPKNSDDVIRACLESQDASTLYTPVN